MNMTVIIFIRVYSFSSAISFFPIYSFLFSIMSTDYQIVEIIKKGVIQHVKKMRYNGDFSAP
jgi:hypothetical protein